MDNAKSCTNCVKEYRCKWSAAMVCGDWKPDLDTERATEWQSTARTRESVEKMSLQSC